MKGRPTGTVLAKEIAAYVAHLGCTEAAFARAVGVSDRTINSIRHSAFPKERTIERLRNFMAAWPDALPDGVAERVRAGRGPAVIAEGCSGSAAVERARAASIAPARPSISEQAAREADRAPRRCATGGAGTARQAARMPVAEALSTLLVETPGDLIAVVRRRWPQVWDKVRSHARAAQLPPGAMLIALIERGLEHGA